MVKALRLQCKGIAFAKRCYLCSVRTMVGKELFACFATEKIQEKFGRFGKYY